MNKNDKNFKKRIFRKNCFQILLKINNHIKKQNKFLLYNYLNPKRWFLCCGGGGCGCLGKGVKILTKNANGLSRPYGQAFHRRIINNI